MRFGTTPDGDAVELIRLTGGGTVAQVLTWGATLQDLRVAGVGHSLVLGSEEFAAYLGPLRYAGAVVGPVANRIAGGTAVLDGQRYEFERNENGVTTLHGGHIGTDARLWSVQEVSESACTLTLHLPDGEGGFPGNRDLTATYALDDDGALMITLTATTDAPTWINLASHGYWTVAGRDGLGDQMLQIGATRYLPVDDRLIPDAPAPVAGTRYDFRKARPVVREGDVLLDHNFCLDGAPAVTLTGNGVRLTVTTDAPGLQVYEAVHLDAPNGHDGRHYGPHAGLAIEPNHWPDSPNNSDFPSIRLDPGETWRQVSRFHVQTVPT